MRFGELSIDKHTINIMAFFVFCCCSFWGNTVKLIGLIVLVVISMFTSSFKLRINKYSFVQIIFFLFVVLSYYWSARDAKILVSTLYIFQMIFTTAYLMIWIDYLSYSGESIIDLFKVFVISQLVLSAYIVVKLAGNYSMAFLASSRLGDNFGMNANEIGVGTALGAVFCFSLIYKEHTKKIYYIFTTILTIVTFLTASRKAILMLIVGILMFKLLYDGKKRVIKNVIIILVCVFLVYYLLINIEPLYYIIGYRIETIVKRVLFDSSVTDGSIELREYYRQYAIGLFKQKSLIGWGVNGFLSSVRIVNPDHAAYSHCNYTELLANYGMIGFVLYYGSRIVLLYKYFKKRIINTSKVTLLMFLLLLLSFVLDYGMVSYTNIHFQIIFVFGVQVYINEINQRKQRNCRFDVGLSLRENR